ncbi:unnamed protein product [Lampetra fluviatilis]
MRLRLSGDHSKREPQASETSVSRNNVCKTLPRPLPHVDCATGSVGWAPRLPPSRAAASAATGAARPRGG